MVPNPSLKITPRGKSAQEFQLKLQGQVRPILLLFGPEVSPAQDFDYFLLVEQSSACRTFDLVVIEHLRVEVSAPHEATVSIDSGNLEKRPSVEFPVDRTFTSTIRADHFACHKAPFQDAVFIPAADQGASIRRR